MEIYKVTDDICADSITLFCEAVEVQGFVSKIKALFLLLRGTGQIVVWENNDVG